MLKNYTYKPPNPAPTLQVLRVAQDRWAVGVFRTLEWTEVASFATEPEAKAFLRGVLSAETTLRDIRSALREAA